MKWFSSLLVLSVVLLGCSLLVAEDAANRLDLNAKTIFSKGPNEWNGDVLEITRGRGAIIGWYVRARQAEEVTVFVEYSCAQPLNQAYQLSFDGEDRFWEVPTTPEGVFERVKLDSFRMRAGLPVLVMLVPPSGTKYSHPFRFRKLILESETPDNLTWIPRLKEPPTPDATPGFGRKLTQLHPALRTRDLRVADQTMRVTGMALRSPRELIFTTWEGDLFSLALDEIPEHGPPSFRRLARGLSEPMGLAVQGERIFVTEKNQVTELIDEDGDGIFETYRCLSQDWPCTLDYHEYLFGAVVRDSYLYFSLSVAMGTRGKDNRQAPLRGSVVRVQIDTGETEIVAGGLRTPDGIGLGPENSLLVTDNQGEWLPANKLIHVQQGGFYQFRSRPPWHPFDRPRATPPAVWLPQGEIASSPTQPILLPESWGPYAGQVVFGDATFGGLQRVCLEEVEGEWQGAVFPFSQGFQHLFHRFEVAANGDLYAGGIARGKDWDFISRVSGVTQIQYTGKEVFEPLSARLRTNGLEIDFTEPLAEGYGWEPTGYHVTQWGYQATQTYGGNKVRHRLAEVRSASVASDRRSVFLEIPKLVEGEVLSVRLPPSLASASGRPLWTGDLWYTINRIPADSFGEIRRPPLHLQASTEPYFQFSKGNAGRVLYQNFCASCHSLDGSRLVGPSFLGLQGSLRKVVDSTTGQKREIRADVAYLRDSITDPNALLVEGYPENLMPPLGGMLTEAQIKQLVDYIVLLTDPEIARQEALRQPQVIREWTMQDFTEIGKRAHLSEADATAIDRGKQALLKAQCLQCHAVSGYGARLGPDLVESVKKHQGRELLLHILEPSREIHPKFQTTQFLLESGKVVVGNIIREDSDVIEVATNLLTPHELTLIDKQEIEEQVPSPHSAMPAGLLNLLTKQEIVDLLIYLESGPAAFTQPTPSSQAK